MSAPTGLRGDFASASKAPTSPSLVESKADRVKGKAEAHYERHHQSWISARFTALLLTEGHQPALRPDGAADDRKAHLFRTATRLVEHKQYQRIARIEKAAQRMAGNDLGDGIGR